MEIIHDNVLDQRESVELDKDLENFLSEVDWRSEAIEENIFDPTMPDIPVSYTISWNNVPFAPIGGLCGLNGQPGNGKSMTFCMLISALLSGNCEGIRSLLDVDSTSVLYIDTEMEMVNTQRVVRRIYNLVGWEQRTIQPRFTTICLREVNDAVTRWRKILKAIWQIKPTVVFLDGLIDVVKDFNDNQECQDRIYQCMSVATHYNICLWCLLHLNPGSDKAVGHLGSFLERKATDIFVTSKDDDTQEFKVVHKKQRLMKAPNINFIVKDDENHYGHPIIKDNTPVAIETKDTILRTKVWDTMKKFVWKEEGMRYSEIIDGLKQQGITSNRMLSDYITIAMQMGKVVKDERKKRYFLVEKSNVTIDSQTTFDNNDDPF